MARFELESLFRKLVSVAMVVSLVMLTGAIVRNIHHPKLQILRDPVLFVSDLPRELYREFFLGLETTAPKLPSSVSGEAFDPMAFPMKVIYSHKGRVFSNQHLVEQAFRDEAFFFLDSNMQVAFSAKNNLLAKHVLKNDKFEVEWQLPIRYWHHNTHIDQDGYIYSPTYFPMNGDNGEIEKTALLLSDILARDNGPPYADTKDSFRDDGVVVVDPDGDVVHKQSLTDLFVINGLESLIYAGGLEVDPFHLNSVVPATRDYGRVKKGDLLLSLRHKSMLLIYRPATLEIIWHEVGPWLNQHSAKFDENGNIYLFNNNVIETHYRRRRETGFILDKNEVLLHNIESGITEEIQTCVDEEDLWTVTGGEVTISGSIMHIDFSNVQTQILCDLNTMKKTILLPDADSEGYAIPGTGYKILNFSRL